MTVIVGIAANVMIKYIQYALDKIQSFCSAWF